LVNFIHNEYNRGAELRNLLEECYRKARAGPPAKFSDGTCTTAELRDASEEAQEVPLL
jgi:hypothetical protein